jgi:Cu/Ag efflux pump CusA
MGRIDATEDFNNIVIASKNGTPIRVADIGHAEDSFERRPRRCGRATSRR